VLPGFGSWQYNVGKRYGNENILDRTAKKNLRREAQSVSQWHPLYRLLVDEKPSNWQRAFPLGNWDHHQFRGIIGREISIQQHSMEQPVENESWSPLLGPQALL
jgi:hypothetical protein